MRENGGVGDHVPVDQIAGVQRRFALVQSSAHQLVEHILTIDVPIDLLLPFLVGLADVVLAELDDRSVAVHLSDAFLGFELLRLGRRTVGRRFAGRRALLGVVD